LFKATHVATRSHFWRRLSSVSLLTLALFGGALAQNQTFAGDEHHTNQYSVAAQNLNKTKWFTAIDNRSSGNIAHYGQPLVTPANTVIIIVLNADNTFTIKGLNAADGSVKWTVNTDYLMPAQNWIASYQPCVTDGPSGKRLYYQGKGGTLYYIDNIDSNSPTAPTQIAFYGISNYNANPSGFDSSVFADTPITADSAGNIYFGFRVQGATNAPAPLNTTIGGWARISSAGVGTWKTVDVITGDSTMTTDSHNVAPALSNDESTVYVICKGANTSAYIVGLDSTNLTTKYQHALFDPRPSPSGYYVTGDSTASPMVGPDGDVYFGVLLANNYSRGALLHFSGDLSTVKTSVQFGWDYTPGVVPASMVPSYHGSSSYLLFCKYNNYGLDPSTSGDQINTVAILDPNNETQIDWHAGGGAGWVCMREVMTVIGCTPDVENASLRDGVREWCVNATAVNPITDSIFFNSEDGNTYRWNLTQNSLDQTLTLTSGFGEPYVPQSIGPDGTTYTFNGTWVYANGEDSHVKMTIDSSAPDNRYTINGDSVTFTAHVTGDTVTPTGTVTFTDKSYGDWNGSSFDVITNTYGPIALSGGVASQTITMTSNLTAGSIQHPSHFITAQYSGDGTYAASAVTRVQKVHSNASTTALTATPNPVFEGQTVTLQATVTAVQSVDVPNSFVTFRRGNLVLGQVHVDGSGVASMTTPNIPVGHNTITADFVGDTEFAASTGTTTIDVYAATLSDMTISPTSFRAGQSTTGTITLVSSAPAGGATVNLSSDTFHAAVPAQVVVPAGSTTANFTINGFNSTTGNITANITASLFGSTPVTKPVTVQPANYATFVSQIVPTAMTAGQTYPVTEVFKNVGTTTWTIAAGYKLQFRAPINGTTFGINRLTLSNNNVAPNTNGTFTGNVIAPTTPGTYNFQWACIEDSINQVFSGGSTNVPITVTVAADAAQYVSRTGALTVNAGTDFWVQNIMKNVGTNAWSGTAGYSMMSLNPNNNTTWAINRLYLPSNTTINNGTNGTFTGLCTAPFTPGTYQMQWQCDKSGTPFGDKSPLLNITVVAGPDNSSYISETQVPTFVGPSTTFQVQFTMKNTGTSTWDAQNYSLLPIGSNNFGVASITSPTVAPNANGTFPAASAQTFTAPAAAGTYTFQWKMAHGSTRFGTPTPKITITVVNGDASEYISRTGALTVSAGQDFYVQNLFKNTGITTWSTGTGYSMMTINPLNDNKWTVTRGYIASGSIAPGSTGTFTALCTAPITPGTYSMQWHMDKSGTPFGETSPLLNITVNLGADDAQFVSQSGIPNTIVHGTTFNATVTMKNLGTATWGAGYTLNAIGNNNFNVASINAVTTAQNGTDAFSTTYTAPATPGTYTFQMRMAHNGTKFGQPSTTVTITVT